MNRPLIAPSVLACDFANVSSEIEMLNESEADYIHIDIMDGVFVPNLSFGFPVMKAMQRYAKKPMDVHLMIVKPENYIEEFVNAGAKIISVHYEACPHLHRNLQQIKSFGIEAGVAINPATPVNLLADVIHDIDLVCLMSVNPGFGGQKFIEHTYSKVEELKRLITSTGSSTKIEIDGGVTGENAKKLLDSGADVLVAGSFVFKAEDPISTIHALKNVL